MKKPSKCFSRESITSSLTHHICSCSLSRFLDDWMERQYSDCTTVHWERSFNNAQRENLQTRLFPKCQCDRFWIVYPFSIIVVGFWRKKEMQGIVWTYVTVKIMSLLYMEIWTATIDCTTHCNQSTQVELHKRYNNLTNNSEELCTKSCCRPVQQVWLNLLTESVSVAQAWIWWCLGSSLNML